MLSINALDQDISHPALRDSIRTNQSFKELTDELKTKLVILWPHRKDLWKADFSVHPYPAQFSVGHEPQLPMSAFSSSNGLQEQDAAACEISAQAAIADDAARSRAAEEEMPD